MVASVPLPRVMSILPPDWAKLPITLPPSSTLLPAKLSVASPPKTSPLLGVAVPPI